MTDLYDDIIGYYDMSKKEQRRVRKRLRRVRKYLKKNRTKITKEYMEHDTIWLPLYDRENSEE